MGISENGNAVGIPSAGASYRLSMSLEMVASSGNSRRIQEVFRKEVGIIGDRCQYQIIPAMPINSPMPSGIINSRCGVYIK
jgi:hypothetical protein